MREIVYNLWKVYSLKKNKQNYKTVWSKQGKESLKLIMVISVGQGGWLVKDGGVLWIQTFKLK